MQPRKKANAFMKYAEIEFMQLSNFFRRIFTGFSRKDVKVRSLVDQIDMNLETILVKSANLGSQFEEEKKEIEKLREDFKKVSESKDLFSAKLEQDILGKITAFSSDCDKSLSGDENCNIKESLGALKTAIAQRLSI